MNPQSKPDPSFGDRTDFHPGDTISPRQSPVTPPSTEQRGDAPVHHAHHESGIENHNHTAAPSHHEPRREGEAASDESNPVARHQSDSAPAEPEVPQPATTQPESPSPMSALPEEPAEKSFYRDGEAVPASTPTAAPSSGLAAGFAPLAPAHDDQPITWAANEFIAHAKSSTWFMALAGAAVAGAVLMYLITQDVLSTIMVVFGAVVFGISAARSPREIQYAVDRRGLTVGSKRYPYASFRSFAVVDEGDSTSLTFMPLKRFAPAISVHLDQNDEEDIVNLLANHLPMQEHTHDPVDKLMRHIRF